MDIKKKKFISYLFAIFGIVIVVTNNIYTFILNYFSGDWLVVALVYVITFSAFANIALTKEYKR